MIETSNPQIDVADLMQRVRAEAAALKLAREQQAQAGTARRSLAPARLPVPIAVPEITLPKGVDTKKDRLEQMLLRARHKWEGRRGFQKFLRRLFPRQRPFNRIILEVLAVLTKNDRSLANRIQQLTDCVQAQQQVIRALAKRGEMDATWMRANGAGADSAASADLERLQQHVEALQGQADRLGRHLVNLENEMRPAAHAAHALQGQTDRLGTHVLNMQRELSAHTEYLRSVQTHAENLGLQLNQLQLELGKNTSETRLARRAAEEITARRSALEQQIVRVEDQFRGDAAFIKATVSEHSAVIERLLRPPGEVVDAGDNVNGSADAELDAFLVSLRDRIRGSRAEVKAHLQFYLPFIAEAAAGSAERPIIDLACGRGEWLELLGERKFTGRGVDTNQVMIAACREAGVDAEHGEPVSYLQSLADASAGAVIGFHLMERISAGELMRLMREARRVLMPGAIAIFESPNCKNLTVGACSFYAEPTHRQPVVPETAACMLESVGFTRVQITYLAPAADSPFKGGNVESAALKELVAGPQVFALIAHVPRSA